MKTEILKVYFDMKKKYITKSYEETQEAAMAFAKTLKPDDVIIIFGDLGAGKTCFTNGILYGLGFMAGGSSPTFTIVNEYPTNPKMIYSIWALLTILIKAVLALLNGHRLQVNF